MDLGARLRRERESFLRKLNGETESEITEDNLDPIIRDLRVSLASVEHYAKEAFEKTQRDITTLRLIQKLAATLRWPESRKVGATVSRLTDSRRSWKGPQRLSAVRRSSFPQIDEVEGAKWLESMPVP